MAEVMSACGVLCSGCAAFNGRSRGLAHQAEAADAWRRIYGFAEGAAAITCGGCLSSDDEVFHSSRTCRARRCCRAKGLASCAECDVEPCAALERAQAVWDGVPAIAATLSKTDRIVYAEPYRGHRDRLAQARLGLGAAALQHLEVGEGGQQLHERVAPPRALRQRPAGGEHRGQASPGRNR